MSGVILNREISIKLERLMHMRYKPSEIALELGLNVDTIYRSWLPAGIPFQKDSGRHIWIVGDELVEWIHQVKKIRRSRTRLELALEQAYCMRCRRPVVMQNPRARKLHETTVHVKGSCPGCGGIIYRIALTKEWTTKNNFTAETRRTQRKNDQ